MWPSKADQILRKTIIAAANQGLGLGLARLVFVQFMTLHCSCPGLSFQRQMPELGRKSAERRKTAGRLQLQGAAARAQRWCMVQARHFPVPPVGNLLTSFLKALFF